MSWRDRVAKVLVDAVSGKRIDLPTKAYHGSPHSFSEFETPPVGYMLDRGLGTHVAKDPALATTFADRFIVGPGKYGSPAHLVGDPLRGVPDPKPQVYPVNIPAEDRFLQVTQPAYDWKASQPQLKPWQGIAHDEHAIEKMMATVAYRRDPEMLARYLSEARQMSPHHAERSARAMTSGEPALIEGKARNLEDFVRNYGGKPYSDADRKRMTELARQQWQEEGHVGLRYLNTSPMETKNVQDATSYIVFDPADIRSRFAQFDPSKWTERDLLAGVGGTVVGSGAILGELAADDRYGAAQ